MTYFEQAIIALPVMTLLGVMISVAVVAGIEGVKKKDKKLNGWLFWTALAMIIVVGACVYWFFYGHTYFEKISSGDSYTIAGQAGDMFGGITAMFSGLAFVGLMVTIYLQRVELRETREVFRRQKFEHMFFQILKLFREYVDQSTWDFNSVNGQGQSTECTGPELLKLLAEERWAGGAVLGRTIETYQSEAVGEFKVRYYKYTEVFLGPYFRMLWNVVRLIDKETTLTGREKKAFVQYVRATLSPSEVKLIAMVGLSEIGEDAGRNFIPRYELIKYLRPSDAGNCPFLVLAEEYGRKAFGKRFDTLSDEARRGMTN